MESIPLATEFASPERSSESEIRRQSRLFSGSPQFKRFANFVPDPVLVLNRNRQVVFANIAAIKIIEAVGTADPKGLRPGEALRCENALIGACGCGTSSFCRYCGAVKAILSSLAGVEAAEECRINQGTDGESFLFKCYTYPLKMRSDLFSLFILRDITQERRARILEHIFFHDIKNTLTALNGWINVLKNIDNADMLGEVSGVLVQLSSELVEAVNAQEQLMLAESNQLAVHIGTANSVALLTEARSLYLEHEIAQGKEILIDPESDSVEVRNDPSLLKRVLCNMTKNALEAAKEGDAVTLGCRVDHSDVEFWVHNPGFIPADVQSQIFKWSFSTKGTDRGLGTYGMRLLTERYLSGRVSFVSTQEDGTTFIARYPLDLSQKRPLPTTEI